MVQVLPLVVPPMNYKDMRAPLYRDMRAQVRMIMSSRYQSLPIIGNQGKSMKIYQVCKHYIKNKYYKLYKGL